MDAAVAGLVERGWIRAENAGDVATLAGTVRLTDDGREQHARISADVRAMRASITDGLTAADYRAVVTGLARMAENLELRLAP